MSSFPSLQTAHFSFVVQRGTSQPAFEQNIKVYTTFGKATLHGALCEPRLALLLGAFAATVGSNELCEDVEATLDTAARPSLFIRDQPR